MSEILSEIDRQLGEQRSQADALASRSGVLIAVAALVAGFGTSAVDAGDAGGTRLHVTVGVAAVLGILVLWSARLVPGPSPVQLAQLPPITRQVTNQLETAKIIALEANMRTLARSEIVFAFQAVTTVLAIVFVIVESGA